MIRFTRHRIEAGDYKIRVGGVLLGRILRWDDGTWCAYPVDENGTIATETSGTDQWMDGCIRDMLDAELWRPPDHKGKGTNLPMREAEAESRAAFPAQWAWYERVKALLEANTVILPFVTDGPNVEGS